MTARRFTLNEGEKALLLGCHKREFEAWFEKHPVIKERVLALCEDDMNKMSAIPTDIKGILFCRHINHADSNRIKALAEKNGVFSTKFFPRTAEAKTFLEMSTIVDRPSKVVLVDTKPVSAPAQTQPVVEQVAPPIQAKPTEAHKPKKGELRDFILENADFSARAMVERSRLMELAKSIGLATTPKSIEISFYNVKRMITPAPAKSEAEKQPETKPAKTLGGDLKKYKALVESFGVNMTAFAAAMTGLVEKLSCLEEEISSLRSSNTELKKENKELKKKVGKSGKEFRSKISKLLKSM